jgi:hypothetical protein
MTYQSKKHKEVFDKAMVKKNAVSVRQRTGYTLVSNMPVHPG